MEPSHADYLRAEWRLFQERKRPFAAMAEEVAPGARRVLDVGCGAGQELSPCAGALAVGVDVLPSSLAAARALFAESGLRAPALLLAGAEALPFATASFDVVISRLALHYAAVRRAVPELARVARPGGALVLQAHHVRYYLRRARGARDWRELVHALRVMASGALFALTGLQLGETFLLTRPLVRLLGRAGFEVLRVDRSDPTAPILVARRAGA